VAIRFFKKSLTEHRTPDILNKLKDAERAKAAVDRAAYINPAPRAKRATSCSRRATLLVR
jgi:stress-induced-phosphoprotein 1